jgi:hypothetical protein
MTEYGQNTVKELLDMYVEAARGHGLATRHGDAVGANKQHDIIAAIYREIRKRGIDAQSALLALLDHDEPPVRMWAAAHALEFAPARGEAVLTDLLSEEGLEAFNAEMTLEVWRAGELRFP